MSKITRTIYGTTLQTELLLGLPHTHVDNTTLNERFDVFPRVLPTNSQVPTLHYIGIGNGGHRHMVGADSIPYTDPIEHDPTDAAAYRPIPFVMRPVGEDLSPAEREEYAMRRVETHGGQNYFCYYLRRLDLSGVTPTMLMNVPTAVGGGTGEPTIVPSAFVPTGANLNPTPSPLAPVGTITTDGSYLTATAPLVLSFNLNQINELLNVGRIRWNNERMVVLSEFQFVAGVDQVVTSNAGGVNVTYREALEAIVVAHMTADYTMANINKALNHTVQLGAIEPLLVRTGG